MATAQSSETKRGGSRESRLRVLVVEDDALLAEALGRLFARRGYEVRVSSSANQAEVQAAAEAFDCGIFDIELGADDGIFLAARLLTARLVGSAVFYSASIDAEACRRAANIGTFVSKEAAFDDLARAVAKALEHRA